MTPRARRVLAFLLTVALGLPAAWGTVPPTELQVRMPALTLAGQSTLRFWGFDVYTARLWVAPGFQPQAYERHAFALELVYQRSLSGEDITQRSLVEMRRQPGADPALLKSWEAGLRAAIPDVRKGDRLIGLHAPGAGTTFLFNGKPSGAMSDANFARLFFGIWLAPETSEPLMRATLLGAPASR